MIRSAALRRLGPSLIGLFIIAQICGVVQLLGEHTAHVAASELILSNATATGNAPHSRHHYGDADGAIQHHQLQDLTGAPESLIAGSEPAFTHVRITAYLADPLIEGNPVLLERPPKTFLSV